MKGHKPTPNTPPKAKTPKSAAPPAPQAIPPPQLPTQGWISQTALRVRRATMLQEMYNRRRR